MKTVQFPFLLLVCYLLLVSQYIQGQAFQNSSLDGTTGYSTAPTNWQLIPYTDAVCNATSPPEASVDLCDITGPDASYGIYGNPYFGDHFVCGLYMNWVALGLLYHEGIMQTVTAFTPGNDYTIYFHQAVIKQGNALDESGGWSVYFDNTLIANSAVSNSSLAYNVSTFNWEQRSVTFTATATSHTIKFIPYDDDGNQDLSSSDITGALRMGIDRITFDSTLSIRFSEFTVSREEEDNVLKWKGISSEKNVLFIIENGDDGQHFTTVDEVWSEGESWHVYVDENRKGRGSYYRIVGVESDGKRYYSEVKKVNGSRQNYRIEWSSADRKMIITNAEAVDFSFKIVNASGLTVFHFNRYKQSNGTVSVVIPPLPTGIYSVIIEDENGVFVRRLSL